MRLLFLGLVALIAVLHLYIAWFEIFAWTSRGPEVFDTLPAELFPQTAQLAANQGVYNAFLAVGLIWALFIRDSIWQRRVAICFLSFFRSGGWDRRSDHCFAATGPFSDRAVIACASHRGIWPAYSFFFQLK